MPPHTLFVLADRWDALGARLTPITNAIATADALGAEFRFVWPRRADTLDYPASRLLSPRFCARHEVPGGELDDLPRIDATEVFGRTLATATAMVDDLDQDSVVLLRDPYPVAAAFADEEPAAARARFRRAFARLELGHEAAAISEAIEADLSGIGTAVHVRYGDIVSGAWSQFVWRQKFRPSAFVERALAVQPALDPRDVLVVSDTTEFVEKLQARFPFVRGLADLCARARELSEPERGWADFFALLRAERILAPSFSAFSGLAALAGGAERLDVIDCIPEADRVHELQAALHGAGEPTSPFFRQLRARELCYLLDSDTGELGVRERLVTAQEARIMDPSFVGAHAREAAALVAVGDLTTAVESGARTVRLAEQTTRQDDQSVEAHATLLNARVVASVCDARHIDRELAVRSIGEAAAHFGSFTRAYVSQVGDIAHTAEFVHRLVALALAPDSARPLVPRRQTVRRSLAQLAPAGVRGHLPMPVWQDGTYDSTLALLERLAAWLTTQTTTVLRRKQRSASSLPCSMRPLLVSANGVRWFEIEPVQPLTARGILVTGGPSAASALGVPAWSAPNLFWLPLSEGWDDAEPGFIAL